MRTAILSGTPMVGAGGGLLAIALAQGLALAVAVNVFAPISGAHFNPAVTIGMALTRRIGPAAAGVYVLVQLAAAVTAALMCRAMFPAEAVTQGLLGLPLPQAWVSPATLVLVESGCLDEPRTIVRPGARVRRVGVSRLLLGGADHRGSGRGGVVREGVGQEELRITSSEFRITVH